LTPSPVSVFEYHSMHANKETAMLPKSTNIDRRRLATVGRVVSAKSVRPTQTVQNATTPSRSTLPEPRTAWEALSHVNLNHQHCRADSTGIALHPQTAAGPLDPFGSGLRDEHTPIERECVRIQQERIAAWRSGALRAKVVELPRRSTENGWSYDRAA
jgi:hypothetical protein